MTLRSDVRIALYELDRKPYPEVQEWLTELHRAVGDRPLHVDWIGCNPACVRVVNMISHAEDDGRRSLRRGSYLALLVGETAGNA
ncbi:hypothetical protein ACFOD4_04530 [Pseudoroseomonas globiformis]|uniref:PH domain-containing protein n=1 Tax=Teichococcus globiformis TaxID=2307229 RepID=A0ABV7FXD2_9PROT